MLTLKRLYLYTVLGIALAVLLLGLSDLFRIAFDRIGDAMASRSFISDDDRAALSWALALVIVSVPVFLVHLGLIRRSLGPAAPAAAAERACASRATYFFIVLAATGSFTLMRLFELVDGAVTLVVFDGRAWDLAGAAAGSLVAGTAWLAHVWARRHDLRVAPEQTAGDWLTRGYLYGALFVAAMLACIGAGNVLTVAARQVLDVRPTWQDGSWWYEEAATFVALTVVAAAVWMVHWLIGVRLLRAAGPMGAAHRDSRTRTGYFLAVVLAAVTAAALFASMGLRTIFAGLLDTWSPTDGSRFIEEVGGPLLLAVPFVAAWWWHLRRATGEARAFHGPERGVATRRAGRLTVAFVGLAGLAIGLTWELQSLLDALGSTGRATLIASDGVADVTTAALAGALVGLAIWAPAWALSQRERGRDIMASATATARRAYLYLVAGVAVVALMIALAFVIYQATRRLLGTELIDDASWAAAVLIVAAGVLAYHLYCLRADLLVARSQEAPLEADAVDPRAMETIEISAPAGADFTVFNAAIRSELPEGFELRVVPRGG